MEWFGQHWPDVLIAVLLAIVFAIISDFLQIGSILRDRIRKFQNSRAEQSIALLRKRIDQMHDYKRRLAYDRWIYLRAFRLVFMALVVLSLGSIAIAVGGTLSALAPIPLAIPPFVKLLFRHYPTDLPQVGLLMRGFGAYLLLIVAVIGNTGIKLVSMDTREKVQKRIEEVDREIDELKARLNEMTEG